MMFDIKKPKVKEKIDFEEIANFRKAFWKKFLIFSLIFVIFISGSFYFYKKKVWNFFKNNKKIIHVSENLNSEPALNSNSGNSDSLSFENNENESSDDDENLTTEDLTGGKIVEMEKKFDELEKPMTISSDEAEKVIKNKSQEIILALKNKNFERLSLFVYPNEKLIFAPYCYIKPEFQAFSKIEVKNLYNNQEKYKWGNYNGATSEEIEITFQDYYENFVYDQDFSQAEKISYNKVLGKGNMTNNIQDFFPDSIIVEYHFSGFNPEFEGMDWKSLRLVFVKFNKDWYLKAIVHDNWTI
jgi:hypothetical protein